MRFSSVTLLGAEPNCSTVRLWATALVALVVVATPATSVADDSVESAGAVVHVGDVAKASVLTPQIRDVLATSPTVELATPAVVEPLRKRLESRNLGDDDWSPEILDGTDLDWLLVVRSGPSALEKTAWPTTFYLVDSDGSVRDVSTGMSLSELHQTVGSTLNQLDLIEPPVVDNSDDSSDTADSDDPILPQGTRSRIAGLAQHETTTFVETGLERSSEPTADLPIQNRFLPPNLFPAGDRELLMSVQQAPSPTFEFGQYDSGDDGPTLPAEGAGDATPELLEAVALARAGMWDQALQVSERAANSTADPTATWMLSGLLLDRVEQLQDPDRLHRSDSAIPYDAIELHLLAAIPNLHRTAYHSDDLERADRARKLLHQSFERLGKVRTGRYALLVDRERRRLTRTGNFLAVATDQAARDTTAVWAEYNRLVDEASSRRRSGGVLVGLGVVSAAAAGAVLAMSTRQTDPPPVWYGASAGFGALSTITTLLGIYRIRSTEDPDLAELADTSAPRSPALTMYWRW